VLDGLAAGDRVVTSATFLIDAESNIRAALAAFTAGAAK
jgi:Cu(I)/Ag(I) efflux system membrane fusion protein